MGASASLPEGFSTLEPFVADWAVDRAAARWALRVDTPVPERDAFYEAAAPLLPGALQYLDTKPIADFDDKDQRLMKLLLSLAHVSLAVEVQAQVEPTHAGYSRHVPFTRGACDTL